MRCELPMRFLRQRACDAREGAVARAAYKRLQTTNLQSLVWESLLERKPLGARADTGAGMPLERDEAATGASMKLLIERHRGELQSKLQERRAAAKARSTVPQSSFLHI